MTKKQHSLTLTGAFAPHLLCGLAPTTPILLGYSGGADSSALLRVLLDMREKYGFSLTLAHLDHGIRGEEAARDRAFCCAEAERLGLDIVAECADVPSLAKASGASLEEAARDARYAFFARIMRERNIPILVTAHHATDQLETLLFRLMRGTGGRGLGGIRPSRPFANGFLVRPLLSVSARRIREYCRENGIAFVTDSTNADPSYTRNHIRHTLLPLLDEAYPGVEERASRLARELAEDNDYLEAVALELLSAHGDGGGIPLSLLQSTPLPILRRVFRLWGERAGTAGLMQPHIEALLQLVYAKGDTQEVRLGGGVVAFREGDALKLSTAVPPKEASFCLPLTLGECVPASTGIRICVERVEDGIKVHNLSTAAYIILNGDFDIINKGAYWRERQEGDVILLRGMHRRVRKLQNEAKIPPRLRRRLPILADGEGVLWSPMVGVRDGVPTKAPDAATCGDLMIRLVYENT